MRPVPKTVEFLAVALLALLAACRSAPTKESAAADSQRQPAPLQLIQQIPVPGVSGRIDHFTAYPKRRLLIFAALGNHSLEIVNTFEGRVVHSIQGLDEPQGVLYVPGLDKIFVANAGSGNVDVYDGKTYAHRKRIELGQDTDADNLRLDEASNRVYVGVRGGLAVIDAVSETRVGDELKGSGGHSESFQLEKNGPRIFVNVPEDGGMINVIDRKAGGLTKWELKDAKANFPMTLDEDGHRLFVVTRRPPLLIVLNTDSGAEVARVPVGASCDDVYFDAERKRIYAICGEGKISVIQQMDANHYSSLVDIPTIVGARTGTLVGTNVYVGVPASGVQPAQVWNYDIPE